MTKNPRVDGIGGHLFSFRYKHRIPLFINRHLFLAAVVIFSGLRASALELGAPFADHAVLQRHAPVPVWGWSKPGTEITVAFAGQTQSANAAADGKWMARLSPLEASAVGREMTISEKGGESRTLKDAISAAAK